MENEFPAHIRIDERGTKVVQTCREHSENAAEYAANALSDMGLEVSAYLAGLVHDMGKYKIEFKEYLEAAVEGREKAHKVIHTFDGVCYLLENYHKNNIYEKITCEILAYAVGAHHGLFDCIDAQHENGFIHRLNVSKDDNEAVFNFNAMCAAQSKIDDLFAKAVKEVTQTTQKCLQSASGDKNEFSFFLGLTVRIIASAVMEGDRRDTAEFMSGAVRDERFEPNMWRVLLERTERKLKALPCDTPINAARRKISDICRDFAEERGGIYRLNVPTGGGKTLSSLRYALAHAAKYNKNRIIFVSPLLSILDQNSKVIREYLEADDFILEHHSNVIIDDFGSDEAKKYEVLKESWSAPIIITTLVQFLNTLFDGRTGAVRRFRALSNAVIIIDEVQSVPNKMLSLFNAAMSFLASVCQTTVVLCSATQPYIEKISHPIRGETKDIVPYDAEFYKVFGRTELKSVGGMKIEEIPAFAKSILAESESLLIVCNKKNEAETVYNLLKDTDADLFYLSAAMCMKHRMKTLEEIYLSLASQNKTVCVSTQVIEAGIDISFGAVIRLSAGMDNIVQSAGRCNRNGESADLCPVYIVRALDEDLRHLPEIKEAKTATEQLLSMFEQNPSRYDGDIASEKAVKYYYEQLYQSQKEGYRDYECQNTTLFKMLSDNSSMVSENDKTAKDYVLHQAFATAGKEFTVFDDDTTDVIVPYGEGESIVTDLLSERAKYDMQYVKECVNRAKGYTVSLYSYQMNKLKEYGALIPLADGIMYTIFPEYYSNMTGFGTEVKDICDTQIL